LIDRYVSGSYYPRIQKAFRSRQVHQTKDESFPAEAIRQFIRILPFRRPRMVVFQSSSRVNS